MDDAPLTDAEASLLAGVPALLRAARHHADLSQRELALRAGVSRGVVGNLEAGRSSAPTFLTVLRLLAAAGCRLVALDSQGQVLAPRPYDQARDSGARRWPSHLDVRPVRTDSDWWHGRMLPGQRPLPEFTADWRRLRYKTRVRRTKGQSLEEARARARARNTPPEPEVTGGDLAAG
jgi:transcriptional regulator with XRE-family HTH domain